MFDVLPSQLEMIAGIQMTHRESRLQSTLGRETDTHQMEVSQKNGY